MIMKLHEALKEIVDEGGVEILYDERFVNYMSDYFPTVFQPTSLKKILKYVLCEDYTSRIIDAQDNSLEFTISTCTSEISKIAGYSKEYTSYVLRCLAYAVGREVDIEEVEYPSPRKEDVRHLSFKDVVFFGDAKTFVDNICNKGFSLNMKESNGKNYMLNGSYAEIPCKLMVQISPLTQRTCRIMVIYDDKIYKNWPALKALYFNLKDKLTKKYGKPSSETEAFFPPYKDGCGKEIKLLDENKGAYQTKYDAEGGEVRLVIMSEARVIIAFMDTLGCIELDREFEKAAKDDM